MSVEDLTAGWDTSALQPQVWTPWPTMEPTHMPTAVAELLNTGVDLLSPSFDSLVGVVLIAAALVLASAGGIGGGGILVPLFILVLRWTPRYAIPLSNVTILAGGLCNTWVNLMKRHPNPKANRPMIVSCSGALEISSRLSACYVLAFISLSLSLALPLPLAHSLSFATLSHATDHHRCVGGA
jgi:hypothetical protein